MILGVIAEGKLGSMISSVAEFKEDGIDDVIIGCPAYMEGFDYNTGKVAVIFGKFDFSVFYSIRNFKYSRWIYNCNTGPYNNMGKSVAATGDFNHDGIHLHIQ